MVLWKDREGKVSERYNNKKRKGCGNISQELKRGKKKKMRVLKKKWRKEKESEIDQHVQPHPALHF